MMKIVVTWDWDNSRPRYPWKYEVSLGGAEETGYCETMADCWFAIDLFVSETVAKAIQKQEAQ